MHVVFSPVVVSPTSHRVRRPALIRIKRAAAMDARCDLPSQGMA
jgi:hypothetical protein